MKITHTYIMSIPRVPSPFSGFYRPMVTVKNGRRWTTADHLLEMKFPNVKILTKARVDKVLFSNKTAYGVVFRYLGNTYVVKKRIAVILAAGAIGSAKLLMLSGVGPKHHLKKIGIKVIQDLPVGNNLQDQVYAGYAPLSADYPPGLGYSDVINPISWFNYYFRSKGPLTSVGIDLIGYINSGFLHCKGRVDSNHTLCHSAFMNNTPDIAVVTIPFGISADGGIHLRKLFGINDELWETYFSKINRNAITVLPVLLHPRSTGTVRLVNRNPASMPLIDPNYMADPRDVELMLRYLIQVRKIMDRSKKDGIGVKLFELKFPGCEDFEYGSICYWKCYMKLMTSSCNNVVGTCKMGANNDSVVDFEFRVRETNGLFVVDSSVFPTEVSGYSMGAAIMMAERASDAIRRYREVEMNRRRMVDLAQKNPA